MVGKYKDVTIETVNMDDGQLNDLVLDLEAVLNFSETVNTDLNAVVGTVTPGGIVPADSLVIEGEAGDTVTLKNGASGGWQLVDDSTAFANHDIYAYVDGANVLAAVAIDDDVVPPTIT